MRNGERVMKNMKYSILFGIAFVSVMLFSACDNNLFKAPEDYTQIKDGYGRVIVDLTGETARTVLPSTAFDKYEYTFKKEGSADGTVLTPVNGYFIMEAGTYTVEVKAYIGDAEPYTLAATGVSSQFVVGSGNNTKVEVSLTNVIEGKGKFNYTITCPEGATVEITLGKWPDLDNIVLTPGNVTGGNGITQTGLELDAGSYLLTVLVKKDGLCAGKNEAVRIYPFLVTEYIKDFTVNDLLTGIPPTVSASGTLLTDNTWEEGDVLANGDQWFRFISTAVSQYIHVDFGTLTNMYVQLYDSAGVSVGVQANLSGSVTSVLQSIAVGKVYYIRVATYSSGNSGTYRIAFNSFHYPPSIRLTLGVWEDCTISSTDDEQWFEFAATADTQYIHAAFGTLSSSSGYNIQLYDSTDSDGNELSVQTTLNNANTFASFTSLTIGEVYYIKVTADSGSLGTYRILFDESSDAPLPSGTADVTALSDNTWKDGSVSVNGEQWFSFTAASGVNYIHASFGTLSPSNGIYIQLYVSTSSTLGNKTRLYSTSKYASLSTLTSGQTYYIKVTPYTSGVSGTYQLAVNTSNYPPIPSSGVINISSGVWKDSSVSANDEKWYSFTAASGTNYIHASFGTLNPVYGGLNIQIYNPTGIPLGSQTRLYNSNKYISSSSLTSGQTYYIKVTPYSSNYTGTYQITVNAYATPPLPGEGIMTQITYDTWADGNVYANSEQWFKFTATASMHYIHASFVTLNPSNGINIQLYNSTGSPLGSQTRLYNSNKNTLSSSLTSGQTYYIKVTPYSPGNSGTYKITFNESYAPPSPNVITTLSEGVWADGNVFDEQWFKFTATASTQYIHVTFGTLVDLYIQVYDSTNSTVGSQTQMNSSNKYASRPVTVGEDYYIKVTPYSSYYGTYQITFNTSSSSPSPTLPGSSASATTLSAGVWADGNVSTNSEQWFKFTATASTQYIHASFSGTLSSSYGMNVLVYDSTGGTVVNSTRLYSSTSYASSTSFTSGQTYYIRVTPYSSSYTGSYQIAFNTSSSSPSPALPGGSASATTLSAGVWADGVVIADDEQWFKFTATASTHYIHASFVTLSSSNGMYVQVYSSTGGTVVSQTRLSSGTSSASFSSYISGQTYYIKVTPYSSSYTGTYRIGFNTSSTPPLPDNSATATTLTAGVWTDGNLSTLSSEQWFKFTATASTHYIHASFVTLSSSNGMYVQVYSSTGDTVVNSTRLYSSTSSTSYASSTSFTSGQTYYIKVTPYSGYTGTYQITFNTSSAPPLPDNSATATELTAFVWADGTVSSSGEQWFKFTAASSSTHYIHASFSGTLSSSYGMYVQVYNSTGSTVISQTRLYGSNTYTYLSSSSGQTYYIKVTPYSSYTGTYQITFSSTNTPPPSESSLTLIADSDTWVNGNLSANGVQWFKFTATDSAQYIHISFGTLTDLNVQLYDSSGNAVGNAVNVYNTYTYGSITLNSGQVYYIRVWPFGSYSGGNYMIAFNASSTPPSP